MSERSIYKVGADDPTRAVDGETCDAVGGDFWCTWQKGHAGDHVAGDGDEVCAVWPNANEQEWEWGCDLGEGVVVHLASQQDAVDHAARWGGFAVCRPIGRWQIPNA